MKYWRTKGAFGDVVIELSWKDLWALVWGGEVTVSHASTVISFGKSTRSR